MYGGAEQDSAVESSVLCLLEHFLDRRWCVWEGVVEGLGGTRGVGRERSIRGARWKSGMLSEKCRWRGKDEIES